MAVDLERNYEYISTQEDLTRVITWLEGRKFFALDTETSGLNPFVEKVILLQIGDVEKQWVIDCRSVDIQPLKSYIEDPTIAKVGTNLKFDYKFLAKGFNIYLKNPVDVMLSEQVLRCGLGVSASLEALTLRYLGIQINKDETLRNSFGGTGVGEFTPEQLTYASGDVIYPILIAKKQKPLIAMRGLRETLELEFSVLPVIAKMELAGMLVDKKAWLKLYQEQLEFKSKAVEQLDKLFKVTPLVQGDMFGSEEVFRSVDYASAKQLKKALHKIGIPVDDTEKGTIVLAAVDGLMSVPMAQAIIDYRVASKKVSTYGINFLDAIDATTGRVHSDFPQCWTTTGRLSSKEEDDSETTKVNLMNIPSDKRYRECFRAKKGYKLIVYDYQALEPRITGEVSEDETYLNTFLNNKDIYGEVGFKMLNEEVSKKEGRPKELRDKVKITVLGNNYGTGKPKFFRKMRSDLNYDKDTHTLRPEIIHITQEESDELYNSYFDACPMLKLTLDKLSGNADPQNSKRRVYDEVAGLEDPQIVAAKLAKIFERFSRRGENVPQKISSLTSRRGWVTYSESLGGRKRFFKVYHTTAWTEGRNHPIQATGADILKRAMVLINNEIEKQGYDAVIVNQIHDELIIEVKADQAEAVNKIVKEMCEKAEQYYLKIVPSKVEGGIHDRWVK